MPIEGASYSPYMKSPVGMVGYGFQDTSSDARGAPAVSSGTADRNGVSPAPFSSNPARYPKDSKASPTSRNELTAQETAVLLELKKIDQRVRQHEAAHIAAGGSYVSKAASYSYKLGPDGNRYAVAGEVGIDVSPERDPRATVQKMAVVQRAALAPADPSPQDRAVAAKAAMTAAQAQAQIVRLQYEKNKGMPSVWSASPGMTIDTYA